MFLQPDWWEVMEPGVGTNRYSYGFNDPVNGRDPGGHDIFRPGGTAALEALQDPAARDEIYRQNAETHAELAKQFTEEERDLEDIQYHLDAAAYYEGRVGISTPELLAEAATGAAYLALGARTLPRATAPQTQTVATTRYQTLSELNAAETRAIIEPQPHKNSLAYVGDTHVYAIRDANGNIYKIGESAQGTRLTDGASIRAEQQVRQLNRATGGFFESEIRKTFGSKAEARAYETRLIERFRSMFGNEQLPGNLTNR